MVGADHQLGVLAIPESLRRLRMEEYHRMIAAGVFEEDERLELVEGVLLRMSPQGPDHASAIERLNRIFVRGVADDLIVRPRLPLTLVDDSEPEPDLAIVPASASAPNHHPTTALLVVEVSSDSLAKDRGLKAAVYAAAGIPEYWIVNLVDRCLEIHRSPDPKKRRYRSLETLEADAQAVPRSFDGPAVSLADLFG